MINISSGNGLVANMHQAIAWTNADQGFSQGMLLESHNELKIIHGWLQLISHASYWWFFINWTNWNTNWNTWQDIVFLVFETVVQENVCSICLIENISETELLQVQVSILFSFF